LKDIYYRCEENLKSATEESIIKLIRCEWDNSESEQDSEPFLEVEDDLSAYYSEYTDDEI
jgi:hypothetical protein